MARQKTVSTPSVAHSGDRLYLGQVSTMLGRSMNLLNLFVHQGRLNLDEHGLVSNGELKRFLQDPEVAKVFDELDAPAWTPHPGSTAADI